ncbi:hypothetical protein KTN05_00455 [Paracoccus sp. Z118]|uniref:hypothetical protein n=1 Tax=Paracoccus sp. Z118 TaxID=2851017 RepID=UPI001C2CC559|nr:hypothetical protein [Paracoccus sp. Z118]MBV0890327.1 hypothetical protein [Paracoccus sp. Z118]
MPVIRPELAERLRPWREVAAAALVAAFGAWVFSWGGLVYQPLGLAVIAVALVWGTDARRRMRFRRDIAAPGVVELIEGAVRYYGAETLGGEIALRDLVEVRLLRLKGHPHWRLRSSDGQALLIPVEAAGAATLAHAFAALPGFDLAEAANALDAEGETFRTVWRRSE